MDADVLLATADACLLAPFDLESRKLQAVFGSLAARKLDYADLYFQYTRSEGWSLEEGIVKSGSFSIEQGVGVRAISGEKTAFAYSDDISFDALQDAAKATRAIGNAGSSKAGKITAQSKAPRRYEPLDPLASLDADAKISMLEKLEKMCRALDPRVTQVMAHLGGEYEVVLISRSDGVLAADVRPLVRLSVQVIAERRPARDGLRGRRRAHRLFALHRCGAEGIRAAGGGAGARQPGIETRARGHHDGGAGTGLAGHPAARGDRPRPGRATSTARAARRSPAGSASASLRAASRWWTTARCPTGAARSPWTTRAIRRGARC